MSSRRPRLGIISNPLSRAGRTDRARFGTAAAGLPHAEPASRAELRDALHGFAARGVDLLAVQGGDGTLREVLTALPGAGFENPPAIAVLSAGKTNLAARVLGSAGMGEAALRRLLDAAERGTLKRRALPVLEVSRPGLPDEPPLRGVLFGAAAFTEGNKLAEARLHRRGVHDAAAVALALAAIALKAGLDRGHGLRAGVPMTVAPDDDPAREGRRFLLLATTLDRLMLGLRPFWGEGRGAGALARRAGAAAPPRRRLLGRRARAAAPLDAVRRLSQRPLGAAARRHGRPLRAGRRGVRAGAGRAAALRPRPRRLRRAMTAPPPPPRHAASPCRARTRHACASRIRPSRPRRRWRARSRRGTATAWRRCCSTAPAAATATLPACSTSTS